MDEKITILDRDKMIELLEKMIKEAIEDNGV